MGFFRQEYWSGLPFSSPGDLPDSGTESVSPALACEFFTAEPPGYQFSHSLVSDSLRPYGFSTPAFPVHHQLPELTQIHAHWVGDAIQPSHPLSEKPFSFHLQSFPASGSFQMSQFFASGGQSIGVLTSTSVLPMNIQNWFPLGWTSWISLQSKGFSRIFSNTMVQKHQFFGTQLSLYSNSHIHTWLLEKP